MLTNQILSSIAPRYKKVLSCKLQIGKDDSKSFIIHFSFVQFVMNILSRSLKAVVSPPPQGPVPVFLIDANGIDGGCFADESVFVVATALAAEPSVLDVLSHEAFRVKHQTTVLIDAVFLSPNKWTFQRHRLSG